MMNIGCRCQRAVRATFHIAGFMTPPKLPHPRGCDIFILLSGRGAIEAYGIPALAARDSKSCLTSAQNEGALEFGLANKRSTKLSLVAFSVRCLTIHRPSPVGICPPRRRTTLIFCLVRSSLRATLP